MIYVGVFKCSFNLRFKVFKLIDVLIDGGTVFHTFIPK